MSLKFNRIHRCGFTNIDFRSKGDFNNINLYEPWVIPKEFGTMGKSFYYPSFTQTKKVFSVSKSLNKLKDIVQGSPNPKIYSGALYYKQNKIQPKIIQEFRTTKVAELDESDIGKEKYIGDSMMISDIRNYRLKRKNKKTDLNLKRKREFQSILQKEKINKNKEANQETQLVKIEANETLNDKIDLKKIQEIRLALRRRYANRTDIRKIFKEWDIKDNGEITLYDVYDMLNKFNIPINYNESRVLIASSNNRGTETLNLEEFFHLIFSDNEALKVDLSKLPFKEEKLISKGKESDNLKNNYKKSLTEMNKNNDILQIKNQLNSRINIVTKNAKNFGIKLKASSKEEFVNLLRSLKFHEKYYKDALIDTLFNTYINEDKKTTNVNKLLEECLNLKEQNNLYDFTDKVHESLKNKLENQKQNFKVNIPFLNNEAIKREKLIKELKRQIEEKKKVEEKGKLFDKKYESEILNPIPSTEFINKVYKDNKLMFEKLNEAEEAFVPNPNITLKEQYKTRYNGNPPHKDTFYIIHQDPKCFDFINEKERFLSRVPNDLVNKDKEKKMMRELEKFKRIRKFESIRKEACKNIEKLFEQKDLANQNIRSLRKFNYEEFNKIRNEFIE